MHGHEAHDNAWYVSKKLLEEWKKKDPINRFEKLLVSEGLLTNHKNDLMLKDIQDQIDDAVSFAESSPPPTAEETLQGVYAE